MASRKLLLRAARLLEQEADSLRESCAGSNGTVWVCGSCALDARGKCKSRRDHEEMVRTAKALRESA